MKAAYVYNIDEIPHEEDCLLGVVININRGWHKQRHCGIAFNLHGELRVLHLATHNVVQCDREFNGFICWVKPEMHSSLQQAFCAYLEFIGDTVENGNNDKIPYGFLYDEYARIDTDGKLYLGGKECGLTCATFVLTLFASKGFRLIDLETWLPRDEDRSWFFQILAYFKGSVVRNKMSISHFKRIFSEIGCPRFRPEEIAVSSALYNKGAAKTEDIRQAGGELLDYLFEIT